MCWWNIYKAVRTFLGSLTLMLGTLLLLWRASLSHISSSYDLIIESTLAYTGILYLTASLEGSFDVRNVWNWGLLKKRILESVRNSRLYEVLMSPLLAMRTDVKLVWWIAQYIGFEIDISVIVLVLSHFAPGHKDEISREATNTKRIQKQDSRDL